MQLNCFNIFSILIFNKVQYVCCNRLLTRLWSLNFEINVIFLIKPFFIWKKSQDRNLNILRTKRALEVKQKPFFIIFKELSVAKNCLRSERIPLKYNLLTMVLTERYNYRGGICVMFWLWLCIRVQFWEFSRFEIAEARCVKVIMLKILFFKCYARWVIKVYDAYNRTSHWFFQWR